DAEDPRRAGIGHTEAAADVDRGRLSRSVRSEQADDLARTDAQGETLERDQLPEGHAHVQELDGITHGRSGVSSRARSCIRRKQRWIPQLKANYRQSPGEP